MDGVRDQYEISALNQIMSSKTTIIGQKTMKKGMKRQIIVCKCLSASCRQS